MTRLETSQNGGPSSFHPRRWPLIGSFIDLNLRLNESHRRASALVREDQRRQQAQDKFFSILGVADYMHQLQRDHKFPLRVHTDSYYVSSDNFSYEMQVYDRFEPTDNGWVASGVFVRKTQRGTEYFYSSKQGENGWKKLTGFVSSVPSEMLDRARQKAELAIPYHFGERHPLENAYEAVGASRNGNGLHYPDLKDTPEYILVNSASHRRDIGKRNAERIQHGGFSAILKEISRELGKNVSDIEITKRGDRIFLSTSPKVEGKSKPAQKSVQISIDWEGEPQISYRKNGEWKVLNQNSVESKSAKDRILEALGKSDFENSKNWKKKMKLKKIH